ncbi:hypothetical protein CLV30_11958 [Haloactinopolyspora alba]|uniref:Uncharacterized protein n=1 Tax=Haloactinopolyspora alba TaxID=648780 RepID=A0A2P8DN87_9ACTN|nr:hypothetical protein CLV30_11958 [Haloactinopolyspora alba]
MSNTAAKETDMHLATGLVDSLVELLNGLLEGVAGLL